MSGPATTGAKPRGQTLKRWLWFVGLWAASVAAMAVVGGIIRLWLL